ncbi:hypothetical protein CHUAL_005504 [Chamberlinius hualienensis]
MLVEATGATAGPFGGQTNSLRRGVLNKIFKRDVVDRRNDVSSRLSYCESSKSPIICKNLHKDRGGPNNNGRRRYSLRPGIIGVKGVDLVNLGLDMSEEAEVNFYFVDS